MLNLYKMYDKPKTLPGYNELNPVLTSMQKLLDYKRINPGEIERLKEHSHLLARSAELATKFARDITGERFPEGEEAISKNAGYAYLYALNVLKCRWKDIGKPEAEDAIKKDLYWAYNYARNVIQGRFYEAEPYIMKNPEHAFDYARDIIKGRWEDAEPILKSDEPRWNAYRRIFTVPE